ncbi:MAG: MarR family transcriptional regulator [Anaerolineales bacterium]|jgi:protein-tyrosine-phosphatase/DNA-binding transcriptional ArsR family regulator
MIETLPAPPSALKLLSHDLRWQLLASLANTDLRVQELVERLGQPQNLVSYHLHKLLESGIVREHRSIADARSIYYSLDLDRVKGILASTADALHPGLSAGQVAGEAAAVSYPPARVLFLCTHNSARSQMAEGLLRAHSGGQVEAFSAGTEPSAVHPMAVRAMAEMGIDISNQRSKSLEVFAGGRFDHVITVCDRARELCPVYPGEPVMIHWSISDPVEVTGSVQERMQAFRRVAGELLTRTDYFLLALR